MCGVWEREGEREGGERVRERECVWERVVYVYVRERERGRQRLEQERGTENKRKPGTEGVRDPESER